MQELAAGQDTQKSWPVGITGFGLGVTDQPRTEAPAGTEALAGFPAAPARTTATKRTDIFAAIPLIRPSREPRRPRAGQTEDIVPARAAASPAGAAAAGLLVQNFMVTPMLQLQSAVLLGHARRPEGGERGGASSWLGRSGPSQAESMSRSRGMPSRSLAWMTAAREGPWNRHRTRSSAANSSEPR